MEPVAAPAIPSGVRTVQVAGERLSRWVDGFAERHGALTTAATSSVVHILGADGAQAWIDVPFAPLIADRGGLLTSLSVHVARARSVGVVLVRRGGFAAGVFEGPELVASKVGTAYVQGTTKAGGWSQQRYARRRANQARAAFADAADVIARVVLPAVASLEAVVCGGDRAAVDTVLADARLEPLRALVTGPLLAVGDPRLRVLQQTAEQFRSVRIRLAP